VYKQYQKESAAQGQTMKRMVSQTIVQDETVSNAGKTWRHLILALATKTYLLWLTRLTCI